MSSHEDFRRDNEIRGGTDRSFGLVFAVVFLLISLWPIVNEGTFKLWALIISFVFLILSILRPSSLALPNKYWAKFGGLLHTLVNPIVLGVIFYVVLTPMAVAGRLAGRDVLKLKLKKDASSYWIERQPPDAENNSMKNQF
jgi:hypothetical protein